MKKVILTLIVSLIMISNAHAGLFSKRPVLVCVIEGQTYTFNLKQMPMAPKRPPWPENGSISEITDEFYLFSEKLRADGFMRLVFYNVNRYSGVISGWMSYQTFKGESGGLTKLKTPEVYFSGTCKGVK